MTAFEDLFAVPLRNGVSYPAASRGVGTPMINMKEIFAYDRIADEDCERVPLSDVEKREFLLEPGDLLFARQSLTFQGAGKCSLVLSMSEPRTWEGHIIRVRLNKAIADPAFYFYYFKAPNGRRKVESIVQQVAAAGIRGSDLRRIDVPIPPKPTQRAIADVLSALDDKIAACNRTTEIVQQVAASLFASALRAATTSEAKFVALCEISGGGTPRTDVTEFWSAEIPWATPTDVTALTGPYLESTTRSISAAGLAACSSRLYPEGSILMTSRATIGAFAVTGRPMAVNQGFIVVNPRRPDMKWWIFHEMRSRVEEFLSLANGATFLELSRGKFKELPVRLADEATMKGFEAKASALHQAGRAALIEARQLVDVRDTLLPELMSGRLRVRDAEKQVEAVV